MTPSSFIATTFVLVCYIHAVFAGSTTDVDDEIPTFKDDDEARSSDYANYFSAYNDLYHQKIMLTDHNRMKAYHDAIMENKDSLILATLPYILNEIVEVESKMPGKKRWANGLGEDD